MQYYWKCAECDESNRYPEMSFCESCGAPITKAEQQRVLRLIQRDKEAQQEKKAPQEKTLRDERVPRDEKEPQKELSAETGRKGKNYRIARLLMYLLNGMAALSFIVLRLLRMGFDTEELKDSVFYDSFYFLIFEKNILLLLSTVLNLTVILLVGARYVKALTKKDGTLSVSAEKGNLLSLCYKSGIWLCVMDWIYWQSERDDLCMNFNPNGDITIWHIYEQIFHGYGGPIREWRYDLGDTLGYYMMWVGIAMGVLFFIGVVINHRRKGGKISLKGFFEKESVLMEKEPAGAMVYLVGKSAAICLWLWVVII